MVLRVRRTKTIQCNERVLCLPYVARHGSPLCPISAIRNLLYVSPNDALMPLFSYRQGGKTCWWCHDSFTNRLRKLLQACGYQSSNFSCHSFRRGGASLAFKLGLSITEVKRRGDWSSEAVNDYIFLDDEQDRAIAARLVNGVSVLIK